MTEPAAPPIDVRRAADRFHTAAPGLDSWHSFSFGRHHDPANIHHGLLLASNEERISPGAGFEPHAHRDMEIVTWVLCGSLRHEDSTGHAGVIRPLLAARMSAGSGITHAERNDSGRLPGSPEHAESVHFVQMWVVPDQPGLPPGCEQAEVEPAELAGRLAPIASGLAKHASSTAVRLNNQQAGFSVGWLDREASIDLPDAPFVHLFLASGSVLVEDGGPLRAGDAVRYHQAGARRVTATEPSQLLVWEMFATAFE